LFAELRKLNFGNTMQRVTLSALHVTYQGPSIFLRGIAGGRCRGGERGERWVEEMGGGGRGGWEGRG